MTVQANQVVRNPYLEYQETIREVFARILSRSAFPLTARLFSMACFAFEADSFLYSDNPEFTEEMLAEEVDRVAEYIYEKFWMREFEDKSLDLEMPMSMLQALLLGKVRTCRPAFNEMIMAAWSEYESETGHCGRLLDIKTSKTEARIKCPEFTQQYVRRRDRLIQLMGSEIEEQLGAFCTRFVFNRNYTHDLTLTSYVQRLVLHVVLLKYFLASDPDLAVGIRKVKMNAPGNKNLSQEDRRALASAVSGIIERVEFHAAHETGAMAGLHQALLEQRMQTLAQTAYFILF